MCRQRWSLPISHQWWLLLVGFQRWSLLASRKVEKHTRLPPFALPHTCLQKNTNLLTSIIRKSDHFSPPFLAGRTTDLSLTISPSPHSAEQSDQSDQGDHRQFIGNSLIVTLSRKVWKFDVDDRVGNEDDNSVAWQLLPLHLPGRLDRRDQE